MVVNVKLETKKIQKILNINLETPNIVFNKKILTQIYNRHTYNNVLLCLFNKGVEFNYF